MGRPERAVDPGAGPAAGFAADLRALRQAAGGPSYRAMARKAHYSPATLARAAAGYVLPTLDVTLAYVEACGGEPAAWRERWHAVSDAKSGRRPRRAPDAAWLDVPVPPAAPAPEEPPLDVPVPRQLPAIAPYFTGRREELARITSHLLPPDRGENSATITTVCGGGGMGKTSLALEWAHRNVEAFPDGQLYVNLRGFEPSGPPTHPVTALQGFLQALGILPKAVPADPDAQAALYRSLVAGRRMLVVLDDAAETRQVVPLLPGTGTVSVLITSRRRLDGLTTTYGARRIRLDALPAADARVLLSLRLGAERVAAEPAAAEEILACCGGLPLALTIVAARWGAHDGFPLAGPAAELRDESARLDALEVEGSAVGLRAALGCSHRALSEPAAQLFALMGSVPYPRIGVAAATALAGQESAQVSALLRELEDAHLVTQPSPGHYRMHDLVRLYAAEHAGSSRGTPVEAARARIDDYYLQCLFRAEREVYPQRAAVPPPEPVPGVRPPDFAGVSEALEWLDAEYPNLLALGRDAGARGRHEIVWKTAWALQTYRVRRGLIRDNLASWRDALAAASHLRDRPEAAYLAHSGLGSACVRAGRHAEGLRHLGRALTLAEAAGDVFPLAEAHFHLASAWQHADDDQRALGHAIQALLLFRVVGDPVWIGLSLNAAARSATGVAAYDEARAHAEAAHTLARDHGHPDAEAEALVNLGYVAQRTGNPSSALDYYERAMRIHLRRRNVYFEADVLEHIGHAHARLGQQETARTAWRRAADSYRSQWRLAAAERVDRLLLAAQARPPERARCEGRGFEAAGARGRMPLRPGGGGTA